MSYLPRKITMEEPDELEKKAVEELMREAKRGAARASVSGPSGWNKCPLLKTNKRFLTNTIIQHMCSNKIIEKHKLPVPKINSSGNVSVHSDKSDPNREKTRSGADYDRKSSSDIYKEPNHEPKRESRGDKSDGKVRKKHRTKN